MNTFLNSVIHIIYNIEEIRDYFLNNEFSCDPYNSVLFEFKVKIILNLLKYKSHMNFIPF